MVGRRAEALKGFDMRRRAISGVAGKAIFGMAPAEASHQRVPRHFRNDRRGGDREAERIAVDDGAVRALMGGKSLLPAGVTRAVGRFDRGDTVSIVGPDGTEIGRGICAYSDTDAARIMGRKSREIEKLLGFRGRDEMVHRDDLVLMTGI